MLSEGGEVVDHVRRPGAKPRGGMVPVGNQDAVETERAGDFEIVERVADEEHFAGGDGEFGETGPAELELAVRIDVIQPVEPDEVFRESEMSDDFNQRRMPIGGEDRLRAAARDETGEKRFGAEVELRFPAAPVVGFDEFDAEALEGVGRQIEAELPVVSTNGKIEDLVIAVAIEQRQPARGEQPVHDVDGEIKIVEQSAVPIPDNVAVVATEHGGYDGGFLRGRDKHEDGFHGWTRMAGLKYPCLPVKPVVNPAQTGVRRWKCICAYDGGAFAGWQSQAGANGIQDVIEARLGQIFGGLVRIHGSGRTDAGVHALGQVFHFDAAWRHEPAKFLAALRVGLPPAIQIKSLREVAADFHARFQATGKRYEYRVHLGEADPFTRPYCWPVFRPLDVKAMQSAAEVLRGRHDFRAFTALNGPAKEDTVRELRRLDVRRRGRLIRITAEANGFLYKMVRSLAGVLVAVGDGRLTPAQVQQILKSQTRTAQVQTAPPQGLFLIKVFYGAQP